MEWFVRFIAGGGIALVAGLWLVTPFVPGGGKWALGAALVVVGTVSILAGIGSEVDVSALVD